MVSACTLREVKAAKDAIKYKEKEVLNYFINKSTNAHAESLNSKLKGFRVQLRGEQDLPFFKFRASMILDNMIILPRTYATVPYYPRSPFF